MKRTTIILVIAAALASCSFTATPDGGASVIVDEAALPVFIHAVK